MSIANFHFHTNYSDGQYSPAEMVNIMNSNGYDILIKTDHDTVEGSEEFATACEQMNLRYYFGVEMTANINMDLTKYGTNNYAAHILGLGIDLSVMRDEINTLNNTRCEALDELVNILIKDGYPLRKHVLYHYRDYIADKNSIARELVDIQMANDVTEAYAQILNKQPYCSYFRNSPDAKTIIDVIHRSGGLAIMAHPLTLKRGGSITLQHSDSRQLIEYLVESGLDGLECYYLRYDKDDIDYLSGLADELGLLKSLGSDTHAKQQIQILIDRYPDAAKYTPLIAPLIDKLTDIKLKRFIK